MCNPNQTMDMGWIRLHRKMTDWRYYGLPNMMAVFIHLLLTANHKDGYSFGVEIKRGQVLTSEDGIMRSIRIKRGALRGCLSKLEKSGEIIRNATNHYSLITICNYDSYQGGMENDDQQTDIKQPSNEQQDNKDVNEDNGKATKDIKPKASQFKPPSLEEVKEYISGRNSRINPETFWNFYEAKGWMVGKNKMKDWKACVRTWENKEKQNAGTQHTSSNGVSIASYGRRKDGQEYH